MFYKGKQNWLLEKAIAKAGSERKLGEIDSKYAGQLNDVQTMIKANSIAKEKIVGQIQTVKNGIINNVN